VTLNHVEEEYLKNAKVKLYKSDNHLKNFLDCVKARTKPITCEEVGGRSAICCHLFNQAYYNHAVIKWKPKQMHFASGSGKPEWLTRNYRAPWKV
jgi:hypothetical protein